MTGRVTSREAAETIAPKASLLRTQTLKVIAGSNGLTADEAAEALGLSILSIRPRCTELSRLGKIRDSGARRPNASGNRAIVWCAV